jgi:outer membrane protein OmpA-like peptidoglycan-associated protein
VSPRLGGWVALAIALALAGCGGNGQGSAAASSPPEAAASAVASPPPESAAPGPSASQEAAEASPGATSTPVTVPTPTPDPNLLAVANGTILRSYSPPQLDDMNDGNLADAAGGIGSELSDAAKPPYVFTFEFPGPAKITEFRANLRSQLTGQPLPSLTFAVSTTSAGSGFKDVGTLSVGADGVAGPKTLPANVDARWVRVTTNRLYDSVGATGTIAPPPAGLNPTGFYIMDSDPEKNGALVMSGHVETDSRARFVSVGAGLTATQCQNDMIPATFIGQLAGRDWNATQAGTTHANPDKIRTVINDDASIIAGRGEGGAYYFLRTTDKPKFCVPRVTGTGLHHVLVLDQAVQQPMYPVDSDAPIDGYTFSAIGAGMLDNAALDGQEAIISRDVCKLTDMLGPQQMQLLLGWVAAGHKLILGGGHCGDGADFTWMPFPFTAAEGPNSATGSLIQVENNALGTNDKNDTAHYVDVASIATAATNSLGTADIVTTTDPHWCGHLFTAKSTNQNGFVQMYAVDGTGVAIYDGFDGDDSKPALQKIRQLELALPVPADLPCSQLANEAFILAPSQEATFAAGSAQAVHATMQVLANQGWNGHVTIRTTGDLPSKVDPGGFDIAGGVVNLAVTVSVPATTKPGVYTVNVIADNGSGKTAQASITLTGTATAVALKKQFAPSVKRIVIYGIHFDVDSAHIQPRSEPVIAQIASIMKANPSWRFQVEGHTDSDGGAAYNLALSQRRAQSVVDDLVNHYHIARSRLVAKGYGLTKPVAPNTTDAGKALNRRVELLRL